MSTLDTRTEELRDQAIERIEKRVAFWPHLIAYLLVTATLVTVWFMFSDGGLFWPVFPVLGWGIGILFHAWDTFRRPISEDRIQHEMDRLASP